MSNRTISFLRFTMVMLLLLSVGLLLWQYFGMSRVLRIDSQTAYPIKAIDDRTQGGASVGTFAKNHGVLQLQCDLKKNKYEWPFCEMSIALSNTRNYVANAQDD